MKATVRNLKSEVKEALLKMGYGLDDRLDIDFINEVADQIGLPQAELKSIYFYAGPSRDQRNEDGSAPDNARR